MPDGATIQRMFADVAPGYDRANHALSLGVDLWWRRRAVAMTGVVRGERGLDVCAGTGDLSLALQRCGGEVVGADFCAPMLVRAAAKCGERTGPRFLAADALALPFGDDVFDFATVAFGIRNVSDPRAALREMARVVRPGGRVVVLDFGKPDNRILRRAYFAYMKAVVPAIGWVVCRNAAAYAYILESLNHYPAQNGVAAKMRELGMTNVQVVLLWGGIMSINFGVKAGQAGE